MQNLNLQGIPNHCALEPLLIYHLPKLFLYNLPPRTPYRHLSPWHCFSNKPEKTPLKSIKLMFQQGTSLRGEPQARLPPTPGFPGKLPIRLLTGLDPVESMRSDNGTAKGGKAAVN